MNVLTLPYSLDVTCGMGATLSTEETYIVQNSLFILQQENRFTRIYFWGKIFGTLKDYYIAFGYTKKIQRGRVFYYSTNQTDWALLNGPTIRASKLFTKVKERFCGDPCSVMDCKQTISLTSGDNDCIDLGSEYLLKEEDRLAAVVAAICDDCAITSVGACQTNCEQLYPKEESGLHSWMRLKEERDKSSPNIDGRPCCNSSYQGLRGRWSERVEAQGTLCILRSLSWPGFTVFHRTQTPDYGFVYFGEGIKASTMYGLTD